jgi:hypothetical protein
VKHSFGHRAADRYHALDLPGGGEGTQIKKRQRRNQALPRKGKTAVVTSGGRGLPLP